MRLHKYRRLVRTLFLLSLTGLLVCSYFYLRDQIPDHILVDEGQVIFATHGHLTTQSVKELAIFL